MSTRWHNLAPELFERWRMVNEAAGYYVRATDLGLPKQATMEHKLAALQSLAELVGATIASEFWKQGGQGQPTIELSETSTCWKWVIDGGRTFLIALVHERYTP